MISFSSIGSNLCKSSFVFSRVAQFLPSFLASQAKNVLIRCAGTALNSKLISSQKDLFAPMVVEAVSNLDQQLLALNLVRQILFFRFRKVFYCRHRGARAPGVLCVCVGFSASCFRCLCPWLCCFMEAPCVCVVVAWARYTYVGVVLVLLSSRCR